MTQFIDGERIVELFQHTAAKFILHAQLLKFAREERLVISHIRHTLRLRRKFHWRSQRNLMPCTEDANTKRNRRNVPLTGRAQAQDETQRTLRQPGLIGMRHDGWIEQRCGLRRILVSEVDRKSTS